MLSQIPNASSQAPTHITPPTGAFEVYEFDARANAAVLVGSYGEDVAAAHKAMRRAGNSACIARGGVATTLKGTTPPSHGVRLKAAVKLAWTLAQNEPVSRAERLAEASPAAPAVTTRPVEPAAAPVAPTTTAKPAEEPMPTPAAPRTCSRPDCNDPVADSRGCSPALQPFCRRHRTAAMGMRSTYGLTDEEAAARCVANGSENPPPKLSSAKRTAAPAPAKPAATKGAAKPRAAATAPTPKPAPPVATPTSALADGLARVQRHAAAVARLGGIDAAEQLAALVADAGGVAVVVEALTTLRGIA